MFSLFFFLTNIIRYNQVLFISSLNLGAIRKQLISFLITNYMLFYNIEKRHLALSLASKQCVKNLGWRPRKRASPSKKSIQWWSTLTRLESHHKTNEHFFSKTDSTDSPGIKIFVWQASVLLPESTQRHFFDEVSLTPPHSQFSFLPLCHHFIHKANNNTDHTVLQGFMCPSPGLNCKVWMKLVVLFIFIPSK